MIAVRAGDEVLVSRDPPLWLSATGPAFADGRGARVPVRLRNGSPASVLASLVLRVRPAEEAVARELMR